MAGQVALRYAYRFVIVLSLVALAGCTSAEEPGSSATGASSSASADADDAAKEAAIEAYTNFWTAVAEAGEIPDSGYEDLSAYGAEDALDKAVKLIVTYEELDRVMKGALETNPKVKDVESEDDPMEVSLTDCADSTGWTSHDRVTGEEVDDGPNGTKRINSVVEQVEGTWKVTAFGMGAVGTC